MSWGGDEQAGQRVVVADGDAVVATVENERGLDGEDTLVVPRPGESIPVHRVLPDVLDETHFTLVQLPWKQKKETKYI